MVQTHFLQKFSFDDFSIFFFQFSIFFLFFDYVRFFAIVNFVDVIFVHFVDFSFIFQFCRFFNYLFHFMNSKSVQKSLLRYKIFPKVGYLVKKGGLKQCVFACDSIIIGKTPP